MSEANKGGLPSPTAKKATISEAKLKILIWGDPGAGKSRFGLSAPSPLVVDTEKSTVLYANEFDFLIAEVDPAKKETATYSGLVKQILKEIQDGMYPDVKTLVIDNLTDVLDDVERASLKYYEAKTLKGKSISDLNKLELSKWYAFRKDMIRNFLDDLKAASVHLIMVGRSRLVWTSTSGGMAPTGTQFDGHEIVESLADIIIHLRKEKQGDVRAIVKKSRLAELPDVLPVKDFSTIEEALKGNIAPIESGESDE